MPKTWVKKNASVIGMLILFFCVMVPSSFADDASTITPTPDVQQSIEEKQTNIDQINGQIQAYQQKINDAESQQNTLTNELDLLQNQIEKTQLQIDETNAEIDLTNTEITKTEQLLADTQQKLDHQKGLIADVVQKIQVEDHTLPIQLFYGSDRFSSLIDTAQKLEQINSDLQQAVTDAQNTRVELAQSETEQETKRAQLESLKQTLENDKSQLDNETEAKQSVFNATHQSETRYQKLIRDLQQEQTFVQNQIQELQSNLQQKIQPSDQIGGGLLSWPLDPIYKRISAYFHDPTYPFRNLFEHPGVDIPAPIGTPVHAAAAGYVAWTRRGVQYGNYVMIIHSDGLATLYAHLSRIDVVADQFIPRGGQVGLVGMTGLTTGPHLHFEVRKEGIPTDPMTYLQNQ